MKNMLISLLTYAAGFAIVWNILDFICCTFITGCGYTFSLTADMIVPLTVMLLLQVVQMNAKESEAF